MRSDIRSLNSTLNGIAQRFSAARMRWIMLIFLSYALLSVLLTPVILRQKVIPAVSMRTGAHVAVKDMAWNPFTLTIHLKEMVIGSSADTPLFSVEQLDLDLGLLRSIIHRAVAVDSLTLFNPGLDIHPGTEGNTNLADFLREIESRSRETPSEEGESPLRIAISQLTLKSGQIQMAAHSNGLPSLIQSLDLDLHGLQTFGSSEAEFVVSLKMDDQAQFSAKGTFSLDGSDSDFSAEAHDLKLAQLQSQIPKTLDLPMMEGVLDFSSHFKAKLGPHIQIQMQHLDAALHDVRLSRPEYEQPLLSFKRFSVEEGMLDFAEHRMHFNALDLESPGVTRAKNQNGQPRWLGLMPAKVSSIPSSQDPADASQSGKPWLIDIDQLMFHEIHLLPTPAVSATEQPDVRLGLFEGEEIHLDMANRLLVAKALRLKHSRLLFGLDHDAILPMDGLIPQSGLSSPSVSEEPSAPSPWAIRIMKTELSDLALGVIRVSTPYSAPFELSNLEASLGAIDTNSPQEAPLNLTSNVSSGGKLEVDGKLNLAAKTFHGDVTIDKVGLNPLKSLLSESYRLDAVEGVLSSQVNITASLQSDGLQGDYTGVVGVDGLRLTQSPGDRKLLGWRSLDVQGIKGHLNPFQFSANEIRLQNPDGVIAIHEDKSSNLSDLRVTPPDRPGNKLPRPSSSTTKSSEPDIHIRRIRVEGGKLDYTDESLVLPFSTQIVDLKGAISGWTLDPNGKSLLELNGRIAPYGEAAIHGQLRPRDPKSSLDVDLHFENVVLASLTPYSATFAGRRIANGKLDLNAHYQLEDQQLKSNNRIFLKQLQLGDRVDSPKALSLPLDLAVALLSDTDGNIDLSLPIEGRTDAPDFDYGEVILNAFGNLIKKAVLSPFTALSGALGLHDGEELEFIAFDLGSDVLTPPEKEKIARLAEALNLKPQLQLMLNGGYDPERDLAVLRQFWLRQLVASRLGEVSKLGEDPDPVNPTEASTQRVLEALAKEYQLLDSALNRYATEKGHPADRVGLVGSFMGKGSKTPEFYESLIQLISDRAPLDRTSLKQLAERRMKVVKDALLIARKPIDSRRIQSGEIQDLFSEDGHHLHMPLTLQVTQE